MHLKKNPPCSSLPTTPIPSVYVITENEAELPILYSSFPLAILHMVVYIWNVTFSVSLTLSFLHCVHKYVLYICVSIRTMKIGSSVTFFFIPCTYINI